MRFHENFEWDAAKERLNLAKHKISFDLAAEILGDEEADIYHIDEFDETHSAGEDRYVTMGSHPSDRSIILIDCWTDRSTDSRQITRILSARRADRHERKRYAKEIWGT